jgi:hypothetical protein
MEVKHRTQTRADLVRGRIPKWLLACVLIVLLLVAACQFSLRWEPDLSAVEGTLSALSTQSAVQATRIASQATIVSYLATRQPPIVPPASPFSTPTPYRPVGGSVVIEEGRCCLDGTVGKTIEMEVAFEAFSPTGEVTHMRVRLAGSPFGETAFSESEWQPFEARQTHTIRVALNWVGYHVSAQFRDAAGNLSPVYHDDIAVEGNP